MMQKFKLAEKIHLCNNRNFYTVEYNATITAKLKQFPFIPTSSKYKDNSQVLQLFYRTCLVILGS